MSKPKARRALSTDSIEVIVDGGVYTPARIEVKAGQPVTLKFIRRDPSPCAEKVLFDQLGISSDLALGKPQKITLAPMSPGEYEFTCQMGMYRGKLVVGKEVKG